MNDRLKSKKQLLDELQQLRDEVAGLRRHKVSSGEAIQPELDEVSSEDFKKYRLLLENSLDIIAVLDAKSTFQYVSPSITTVLGYAPESVIGQHIADLLHPDDWPHILKAIEASVPGKSSQNLWACRARHMDGSWCDLEVVGKNMLHLPDVAGIVLTARDVTTRKQAEAALQAAYQNLESRVADRTVELVELNATLQNLINTIPSPIFYKDTQGVYLGCNQAYAEKVMGMTREDIIGHTIRDFSEFALADQAAIYHERDQLLITQPGTVTHEENVTFGDGSIHHIQFYKSTLYDELGNVSGMVGVMMDMTPQKEAIVERESLVTDLERRTVQLQTAAEVSQAATSILAVEQLLPQVVELIKDRFDFYYVGIFLTDESERWAVLKSGTGEAGRKQLEAGHKHEIGGNSMIGACIAEGQARVALDVGEEAVRFVNPLLPDTRSEMALPLISRGQVIGAMTIQSSRSADFSEADITVLQTMANQLANAIQNAQLFERMQASLADTETLYYFSDLVSQELDLQAVYQTIARLLVDELGYVNSWVAIVDESANVLRGVAGAGLDVTEDVIHSVTSLSDTLNPDVMTIRQRKPVVINDPKADATVRGLPDEILEFIGKMVEVPIFAGDKLIGLISGIRLPDAPDITSTEVQLLQTLAAQSSNAIQRARLYAQSQSSLHETAMLYQTTRTLGSAQSVDEILDGIVDVIEFMGMGGAIIHLFTKWNADRTVPVLADEFSFSFVAGELEKQHTRDHQVVKEGVVVFLEDYHLLKSFQDAENTASFMPESLRAELLRTKQRGALISGLVAHGQLLGLLTLTSPTPIPESPDRPLQMLITALADQVAVAIDNITLVAQAQRRASLSEKVSTIEAALSQADTESTLLESVSEAVGEHSLPYVRLIYFNTGTDGNPIESNCVASWRAGTLWREDPVLETPLDIDDDSLAQLGLKSPYKVLFIPDIRADVRVNESLGQDLIEQQIAAVSIIPIRSGMRWLGILAFIWDVAYTFTEEEQFILRNIADSVSALVARRRAYQEQQSLVLESRRRALQLQTASDVARAASSLLNLDELLPQTVDLIRERFKLYYAGIFLVDASEKWAILRAGTGEAGRVMLERGHKFLVGGESMIGTCVANAQPQLPKSVDEAEVRFVNPLLPESRSEIALPLISRGRVIGAMTAQATEPNYFGADDIIVLQTLADQLANAISNARLYAEAEQRFDDLQRLQRQYVRDAWEDFSQGIAERDESPLFNFAYDLETVTALDTSEPFDIPPELWEEQVLVQESHGDNGKGSALQAAVSIRGEPMGMFRFEDPELSREWTEDDLSIVQEVQTQLALALENRLFSAQTEQALAETRRREEEAHFLQDIAAFLNATEDIVEAQNEFLNHLSSFVPVDGLLLFGYRSQGDNLRLLRTSSGETAGHFHWNPEILPDDCAPVWAVQNKESLVLDDIREAPRFFEDEQLVANGIVARAILPLMLGQRVMGALNLGSKVSGVFSRPGVFSVLQQIAAQVASAIERTNLLRQTRSALDESQTLYVATSSLSQATTYEEVLEAIAKHTLPQALPVSAEILLFDQNPQAGKDYHWVQVVASWSRQNTPDNLAGQPALPTLRSNIRVPVSEVPALSYMGSQELLICEDVATDARLDQPAKDFYLQQGIHSLIVAQLAVSGQQIGALHIKFASTYVPSETETRLYSTIADQAAVVLSNRQLIQVSQGRAEQLQAAVEMAGIVTSILERETLIQTAVNYIKNSFDLYYVGLFLNDRQGVWAVLQAGTGDAAQKMLDMGYRLRVGGNSPVGICTKTGDPYLAQGVISEDIKFKNPLLKDTQSEIALPLTSRGRIIGAMTFQSEKRLAFTSEDITTYQLMANQLANVIESANLYQQSQVSLAETTAQYRIAQRIANARTENEVFQSAVDGIAEREEPDMVLAGLLEPVENPKQLRIVAVWNRHGNSISDMVFSIDEIYKVYDLLRIEHRFVTTDLTQDPLADDSLRGAAQQWGMRSMAALQLDIRGYQYGTLMVLSSTGHDFTTAELRFYESVARLAFVALESLQLVERTQAEADRRALLNMVLQTASGILDPEELLRVVVPVVVQGMDMPVMAWRWEGSWLHPVSIMRYDKVLLDIPEDTTFKAEDVLLVGDVVRSKRSVLRTFEPALMQGYSLAYIWDFLQMEEAYAVPLISRDRVLGVFVLGRQLGHPSIDEREQEFIRSAAANISLTLETARLYQETQEANVRLQEVDRVKSEFLANMSHELRTPLNSIIGFSRVILKGIDGPLTEMQETDLKAIHDSGTHLLSLINDILDISKVEAGKMEFFFEPADIKEIVKSVLSTASALVKDRPIKLYQDVPDGLPEVKMDIRRIRQVLTNLIGNASKFTEEGFIRVSASCDDQWLIVGVQDTGIGIPKNRYDAVFASFEQVDSSSTRRYGGTGLGLPVSKSFVEAHGGEMWFESIVGEGSTFFFSLPLRGPGGDEVEDTEPDKDENRIILTVDDDEAVITLFQRFLEQDGYKVLGLTKGRKVVQEAKRLKPYAITLDIMMPDKSGWDIIKELKSDPETRDIPVIVCSIVSDSERGMSMGVADYLVKPITEQDLLEALHRIELPQVEGEELLRRQVLIVDDSADDRKLLRRIMEGAGYKVEEAQGGAEAISKIHLDIPDLIVLDLMMPVVDGFAVLENLRINEATRKVPVIIVTAKELSGPERDKLQQRAQALLQKGLFDQDKLLGDIQEALSRLGKP